MFVYQIVGLVSRLHIRLQQLVKLLIVYVDIGNLTLNNALNELGTSSLALLNQPKDLLYDILPEIGELTR
jgi:hypothetical protein